MHRPTLPSPSRVLDLPGFAIGHGTDREAMTGVTVILCPEGALAAAEVRGSATGTLFVRPRPRTDSSTTRATGAAQLSGRQF